MKLTNPEFGLSFELFPPRSLAASFKLWQTLEQLSRLDPSFVSVTYGAGGATRDLTRSAVDVVQREYGINVAGHLTCVDATKAETLAVADEYARSGANRIVALRGDPPKDSGEFTPHPDGFSGSLELIEALAALKKFHISVAAYPHTHPEARNAQQDLTMLRSKFAAGADSAITQFFFEAEDFLRFRDRCAKAGITQKVIPGILPVENWSKTRAFAARCGAYVPQWLDDAYGKTQNKEEHDLFSIAVCTELCDTLISEGVEDLHFYTLNDANLTVNVCRALGREPRQKALTKVA